MADALESVDPDDPCAVVRVLKAARLKLISGRARASFRSGDEEVTYARADLNRLDREIERSQAACDLSQGRGRRRRFLQGGFR